MSDLFDRLTASLMVVGTYLAFLVGVLMLVIALVPARNVMLELSPGRLRVGWGLLISMILLFIAGYLAQIVVSLQRPYGPDTLVAVVLLFGAWFVLLVCRLARTTVRHVTRLGVLEVENLTDALMGVGNRRFFERRFHAEVVRAKRYGNPLSVLLFDIDHFRQINETYGHEGGDRALRAIGAILRDAIRTPDLVAR